MNSVIRKNLNTIEQNYSKRTYKSTECVTNSRVLLGKTDDKQIYFTGKQVDQI